MPWLNVLMLCISGIILGGMLYTSFLVAPIIFMTLDQAPATRFTRRLWPSYFLVNAGLGLSLLALLASVSAFGVVFVLLAGFILLMVLNYWVAFRLRSLRGENIEEDMEGTTSRYHKLSVWLNYLCLILVAFVNYRLLTDVI